MLTRFKSALDPYILALLGMIGLASLLPVRGSAAVAAGWLANAGIVVLFFLHGAKLSREAILAGAGHWRLHLSVLATTYGLFPLLGLGLGLGLGLAALPWLPAGLASGLLFLTLLPSTVQSSIAFTSIARGNVAAAICSASFSNLLGMVITPALVALTLHGLPGSGVSLAAVNKIVVQLLVPFALGQALRPLVGGLVARHKALIGWVDRGSILLVVYTAFSTAVVEGLWQMVPLRALALVLLLCAALLVVVLGLTWWLGHQLGFARDDRVVLLFCGSKKSLATGVPMAGVLFPPGLVGPIILPLMLFHQLQLVACAVIARAWAEAPQDGAPA
ncbi:bile acid:sodium symporter family protein [Novosphingobium piscinae]|uniref:Bile acid:sodium symporter n=1 Tax=Novosphingobium piscinae TaxID=1507448 RepID=A0A7X1FZ08_9SPHN|nr:bile acid:sodium symporter family protein [Novosphingobium piscinae]MBC2669022.1 bile acid:sodium symporter [Novosphingobium piscinae]